MCFFLFKKEYILDCPFLCFVLCGGFLLWWWFWVFFGKDTLLSLFWHRSTIEVHSSGIVRDYHILSSKLSNYWCWQANYLRHCVFYYLLRAGVRAGVISVLIITSVSESSKQGNDCVRTKTGGQTCTYIHTRICVHMWGMWVYICR